MSAALARELHQAGKAHGAAACLLHRASFELAQDEENNDPLGFAFNGPYSLSVHYLLGLGLELMLKAVILASDAQADAKYLRNEIGHDLVTALDGAEDRGFHTGAPHLRDLVELLREPYKKHWFRYERPEQIPLPGDFDQVVETLTVFEHEVAAKVEQAGAADEADGAS